MSIENILSIEDLSYIHSHEEVLAAKARLGSSHLSQFSIGLTDSIRESLSTHLNLDLSTVDHVPMRWIQGDTLPHADSGRTAFEHTHLVYLSDSPGEFIVGDTSYPIIANTGFVFDEGLFHKTRNTGFQPRLLLGPMNEFAQPVGAGGLVFFENEADAIANVNYSWGLDTFIIPDVPTEDDSGYYASFLAAVSGVTSWRIAPTFPNTPTNIYVSGSDLTAVASTLGTATLNLYPVLPCFLEGTEILCQVDGTEKYLPIEKIAPGTLVKTIRNGFKKVVLSGKGTLHNPGDQQRIENRLYRCSPENYPELTKDIYITGCHSILVPELTDTEREQTIQHLGKIYATDKKYRLIACIDQRAMPWASAGIYTIWHIALENDNVSMNYGVYASGLIVETCSINTLRTKSNMVLSSA